MSQPPSPAPLATASLKTRRSFDDFQIGEAWQSEPFTVSADEIIAFGRLYDPQPMHTDPEAAARSPFGGLIASGWHIAALALRAFIQAGGYGATPVVGLGVDELRWSRPVRAGDTLTVRREVVGLRRSSSNPTHGIVQTQVTVKNQAGELVMSLMSAGRVSVDTGAGGGAST